MVELPQLCAGMKEPEASQSTCQAWLRAWYWRLPSSYFWRSEGLESWEDQGIAVSYRTALPTACREESSIYSLWDRASRSAGVWLVLSLPTASLPAQKGLKSPRNPARLCFRGTTQALETRTDGVFGEQAVSECQLSNERKRPCVESGGLIVLPVTILSDFASAPRLIYPILMRHLYSIMEPSKNTNLLLMEHAVKLIIIILIFGLDYFGGEDDV